MANHHNDANAENSGAAPFTRFTDDSLSSALKRQWGAAPWYVGSFGIHMVILAIMLLFAPEPTPPKKPTVKIEAQDFDEEPPAEEDIPDEPEITEETETSDDITIVTNVSVSTAIDIDLPTDTVTETEEISDTAEFTDVDYDVAPTLGLSATVVAGGSKGGGDKFGRNLAKQNAQKSRQTSKKGSDSLALGLAWLAKVQEEDGHWDSMKYEGKFNNRDAAITSLALLAFLGDGNSSKSGKYKKTVRAAQSWLLSRYKDIPDQNKYKGGRIGDHSYEAAMTMMALAEAWAMSEEPALEPIVNKQVEYAMSTQGADGGWRYSPKEQPADTSVTGWWVMGLKSAKVAGAHIDDECWNNAIKYLKSVTQQKGDFVTSGYTVAGGNGPSMTAVGLTCLQFLGLSRDDKLVKGQAESILKNHWTMGQPYGQTAVATAANTATTNFYTWYYQALGLFQMGTRSEYWKEFRKSFEPILLKFQEKQGFYKGSWVPDQSGGAHYEEGIGRVGVTATACLMLEVYYRFMNVHEQH